MHIPDSSSRKSHNKNHIRKCDGKHRTISIFFRQTVFAHASSRAKIIPSITQNIPPTNRTNLWRFLYNKMGCAPLFGNDKPASGGKDVSFLHKRKHILCTHLSTTHLESPFFITGLSVC